MIIFVAHFSEPEMKVFISDHGKSGRKGSLTIF